MQKIGFSTGAFHNFIAPVSREAIDVCRIFNMDAIEITCMDPSQLDSLKDIEHKDFLPDLSYKSLHAPSRNIIYGANPETFSVLERIWEAHLRLNFNAIIIHPDLVRDFGVFRDCPLPLAFENMDHRKEFGKTVDDFECIFRKTKSRLALDLNHCFTNDRTLELAENFIAAYKDKICEIHLSGYREYHELLHETGQSQIIEVISGIDIPVIIESCCQSGLQAAREMRYICDRLY